MLKSALLILFSLFIGFCLSAQESRWRDHFSYRNATDVAEGETYIATSSEMGLMLFNKLNNEIKTFSRINGLSDVGITALQSINNDVFIIGYVNGNIDVLSGDGVFNIPDFKLKQIQGSKRINHFYYYGGKIFCSTDYAILVLDVEKREISETYFLGYNAERLKIYETVVLNEQIYAATERGLLRANLSDPSIVYDEAWTIVSNSTLAHIAVNVLNNNVVSVLKKTNTYDIFYGLPGQWVSLATDLSLFESLDVFGGKMVISYLSQLEVYNESFNRVQLVDKYSFDEKMAAQDAIYSSFEDALFIADRNYGIVKTKTSFEDFYFVANGPYSNNCFDLHATSKGVYSTAGGITSYYNDLSRRIEYSFFDNSDWNTYRSEVAPSSTTSRDLLRICSTEVNDTVYMCSWGGGIYEVEGVSSIKHYDETNSGLQDIYPDARKYVRVGGIASDSDGNIWMSNAGVTGGIVVKSGNSWIRMNYDATNDLHSTGQFLFTNNNQLWVPITMAWTGQKQGIVVIDTKGTFLDSSDDEYKCGLSSSNDQLYKGQLQLWDENRNVISKIVFSMAEDKNGYIWLGTDKGVLVYYRPWTIFSEDYPVASRIKVPRNDGSNLADYLLEDERVSCIAVDGANRKWLGTENSGLYLVSEDGLKTYQTFNMDNSPLPSNSITSLAISPKSGEVFIGTAKGIVSYKAKATEGEASFSKVYAYPNPVRNDFSGDITVTGLMENSVVKITTVSGKLVHETTSLGGKAYWDGTNFTGEKVKTGVYLVYVSTEDGTESAVTKILIVR